MKSRALVVASILLLAGCGGGGGTTPPQPHPTALPTNSPTSQYKNVASLTLTIPLRASAASDIRHPQYVSPGTTVLTVNINAVNGSSTLPAWVAPNPQTVQLLVGTNCTTTGTTETCTVNNIAAPPGTVNYTFTVGDGTNNLGTFTGDQTITQGINNNLTVTLKGIAKTVSVTTTALTANTPPALNSQAVTVSASDADGFHIVNGTVPAPYNNPITLTDNDATGITSLSLNGAAGASSIIVTNPSDVVTLNYNGQAVNNFTITASGTGITTSSNAVTANVNDVTFTVGGSAMTLDDAAHGGLNTDSNWGQQTLFFSAASGSQTFSAAELGFTNAPYSQQFNIDASLCAGKANVTAGPATTFTVTATAVGVCKVRLSENGTGYPLTNHAANAAGSATHDGTFWISITSGTFTVN